MSTTSDTNPRLFVAAQPGGLVFADRHRERQGDYQRVGFMPWNGADGLTLRANPEADPLLVEQARRIVATYQARRGEPETISTCGQTVRLGGERP